MWLDPISGGPAGWLPATELDQLPADGTPRMFTVYRSGRDAWSRAQPQPVTAVYLRRLPDSGQITALPMVLPCGCFLRYSAELQRFQCPCHHEDFDLEGRRIDGNPLAHDLEPFPVTVEAGVIYIKPR